LWSGGLLVAFGLLGHQALRDEWQEWFVPNAAFRLLDVVCIEKKPLEECPDVSVLPRETGHDLGLAEIPTFRMA